MEENQLVLAAQRFAEGDTDPKTQAELRELIAAGNLPLLSLAMDPPLAFGTAGLRGAVGCGAARINEATISIASYSLARYLLDSGRKAPQVVVGFDARPDSARFARVCAEVLSAAGLNVSLSLTAVATPMIAYAVRKMGAQSGVVITASHNPRGDNGFKVFDGDGVQIVGPFDEEVARRMADAPHPREIPRHSDNIAPLGEALLRDYFADVSATAETTVPLSEPGVEQIVVPYTPLHGVGLAGVRAVLSGLEQNVVLDPVSEQAEPDGTFPTVPFPNPEEPGALDLLLAHSEKLGARVACANDPDADRFALCLPLDGKTLTRLSGDALGLLLVDACLRSTKRRNPEVISTVVSSPGVALLAEKFGARTTQTLTGFKWLCHAALESDDFLFAYEEALGYCFAPAPGKTAALDKDGILALLVAVRLLVQKGGGDGLAAHLLDLYREIGLWGSYSRSRRFEGPGGNERMVTQMDRLRESPDRRIGGMLVTRRIDYREQAEQRPWYLGAQDLVRFDLEADSDLPGEVTHGRVLIRPSGTEPKLKAYVHLHSHFANKTEYSEKSAAQESLARAIARQVLKRPESILPPSMRAPTTT